MIGLGLKLLGIGKFLRNFFLQNWKWIVPILVAVAAFLWTKNHYYDLGQSEERTVWEAKVEAERKKNEELTKVLASSVDTFGKVVDSRNQSRTNKEIIRENSINTIIEEKPVYKDCKVDQEVVEEQNAIKALGPES